MARIKFRNGIVDDPTIILTRRNYENLGQIINISNVSYNCNLNSADELSFTVTKSKYPTEEELKIWDYIVDLKLVYLKNADEYFEITVSLDDSDDTVKNVVGTSLCEAELSQTTLSSLEINTEIDISRDDYNLPTVFYRPSDPSSSLLHRVLDKLPNYTIGTVDASLWNVQRTFSVSGTTVYDFLVGDVSSQFNCLFQFDSTKRIINVRDLLNVCNKCGTRTEFDYCPDCGSIDMTFYGRDTTILVDKENLTDTVHVTSSADQIKNTFKLVAGDDDMTAAIRNINPNGTDYLYYINDEQREDMSPELTGTIVSYNLLYDSYTEEYEKLTQDIYECIDKDLYLRSAMMPSVEYEQKDLEESMAELTNANLSPMALSSVKESTSSSTVTSAIKSYAKVFINSGRFKASVNTTYWEYYGVDNDGWNYGIWRGTITLTGYGDEDSTATTDELEVKVYDNYEGFMDQKIKKYIAKDSEDDASIFNVLGIKDPDKFKTALTYYCLNRLTSFYDSIQGCLDILIEADQASDAADLYNEFYLPYKQKLDACQEEIDKRSAEIDANTEKQESLEKKRREIQAKLNFKNYLGDDLYREFCSYRREDTYSNSNFISTDLDTTQLFENAKEFMELAKKEIYKAGTKQITISVDNLYDLLLIPEFEPLVDYFEIGNWIRVRADEQLYRLRLIQYSINWDDLSTISVDFSTVTKIVNGASDVQSLISSASSLATSYLYIAQQANKGTKAFDAVESLRKEGLDSSLYSIKNSDTEDIVYDKHGILARSYDDNEEGYSPEQLKIVHNTLAFTDNNWDTTTLAIGKTKYTLDGQQYEDFGVNAKYMVAGKIISGDIYSANYSSDKESPKGSHFDLNNGSFTLADGRLAYDDGKLTLKDISIDWTTANDPDGLKKVEDISDSNTAAIVSLQSKVNQLQSKEDNLNNMLVRRCFVEFDKTTRRDSSVTAPTINDYCYMQGGCSDDTYIYIAYSDGIYSTRDYIKLVKYDDSFNMISYKLIACNHANDLTYYDGYIYMTSGDSIIKVNPSTLTIVKTITKDWTVSVLEYYNGKFYSGTMTTCVVMDTDFNDLNKFKYEDPITNYNTDTATYSTQGIFIEDDYIYQVVATAYLIKYDLSGNLVSYIEIDHEKHGALGEVENVFVHKDIHYLGSSTFGNTESKYPIRVQMLNKFDFNKSVPATNMHYYQDYATFTIYVDPSNTSDTLADGSKAHPYPYFGFAHTEAKIIARDRYGYDINIQLANKTKNEFDEPFVLYNNLKNISIKADSDVYFNEVVIQSSDIRVIPNINIPSTANGIYSIVNSTIVGKSYIMFFQDGRTEPASVSVTRVDGIVKINGENDAKYANIDVSDSDIVLWCDSTGVLTANGMNRIQGRAPYMTIVNNNEKDNIISVS